MIENIPNVGDRQREWNRFKSFMKKLDKLLELSDKPGSQLDKEAIKKTQYETVRLTCGIGVASAFRHTNGDFRPWNR